MISSTRPAATVAPASNRPPRRLRIGELLVKAGLVTAEDLARALEMQKRTPRRRLGEILVSTGVVSEAGLARALAEEFHLPFVDLDVLPPNTEVLREIRADVIVKWQALPIELRQGVLVVAVADPLAVDARDAVRLSTRRKVIEVVAPASQIAERIDALLGLHAAPASSRERTVDEILRELPRDPIVANARATGGEALDESSSAVIQLVNRILLDAYRTNASDIHVEPGDARHPLVVRLRVDGDCVAYHELPAALAPPVVARIKIMSDLDIAERRKPQDGKIRFRIGEDFLELRVATIPTVAPTEDVVMRLLPPAKPKALSAMGLREDNLHALEALLAAPYGLILCVGPTGSGKTTTLHSAISTINRPDMKIWTIEEPVEITQAGLRQVPVNRKVGLDFATAMRAFLRADPDVIMVGEMRDHETAAMAIEASLTGHLVLSTLHTNNAPETVVRLLDMGLDPFSFADSLLGVLAQRLARALCPDCREPHPASRAELDVLVRAFGDIDRLCAARGVSTPAEIALHHGAGCDRCHGTGYAGRVAIHELLTVNDAIRAAINRRSSIDAVRELSAEAGMTTLLFDGVVKALDGRTDLKQVLSVCSR